MTAPHPTSCRSCGDRFNRANTALSHICRPNNTGFQPGDPVYVGTSAGVVQRVDRHQVEVYFRSSLRAVWCSPDQLERVTV